MIRVLSELHLFLLAALRELFKAKLGNCPSSDFSSGELVGNIRLHQTEGDQRIDTQTPTDDGMTKKCMNEEVDKTPSEHASLVGLNDPADEFFDVPEPSNYDQLENGWSSDFGPEMYSQVPFITKYFLLLTCEGYLGFMLKDICIDLLQGNESAIWIVFNIEKNP